MNVWRKIRVFDRHIRKALPHELCVTGQVFRENTPANEFQFYWHLHQAGDGIPEGVPVLAVPVGETECVAQG